LRPNAEPMKIAAMLGIRDRKACPTNLGSKSATWITKNPCLKAGRAALSALSMLSAIETSQACPEPLTMSYMRWLRVGFKLKHSLAKAKVPRLGAETGVWLDAIAVKNVFRGNLVQEAIRS
jgi:hypothetical protein